MRCTQTLLHFDIRHNFKCITSSDYATLVGAYASPRKFEGGPCTFRRPCYPWYFTTPNYIPMPCCPFKSDIDHRMRSMSSARISMLSRESGSSNFVVVTPDTGRRPLRSNPRKESIDKFPIPALFADVRFLVVVGGGTNTRMRSIQYGGRYLEV